MTKRTFSPVLITAALLALLACAACEPVSKPAPPPEPTPEVIPDFASFKDVTIKKQTFFEFMLPKVRQANAAVLEERVALNLFLKTLQSGKKLKPAQAEQVADLLDKYRIKAREDMPVPFEPTTTDLEQLVQRVDVVPASLILAQSANESAWGTSRFAKKGKNFFGIWCFDPGCGIEPSDRPDGLIHEVARFDSVQAGVDYYLLTINSHPAYKELRRIREKHRLQREGLRGVALAEGLHRYSERGGEYVDEIQAMIRFNKLQRYTVDFTLVALGG